MSAFVDSLLDLLHPLGEVKERKMFGGYGIYKNGLMFGLVAEDRFYIKTDDENKALFIEQSGEPFIFGFKNGVAIVSKYYEPPESAFINEQKMKPWAMLGWESALRSAKNNKSKAPRKKRGAKKKD